MASSRLVLPLPLSPYTRLKPGSGSRVWKPRLRTAEMLSLFRAGMHAPAPAKPASKPHRHDNEEGWAVVHALDQDTAVGIGQRHLHRLRAKHVENVDQVADV